MTSAAPFLLACRRQPTPYTPVWLMRQAGRFLPEYRAVRERHSFLGLCKSPSAAAEVTVQPVERLGVDAAILFADILLVLEPLGLGLEFNPGDGPSLAHPIRSAEQVRRLPRVDVADALGFVFETVRVVKSALAGRVPLIGFAGAPFTVAAYAIEGGGSRSYETTKRFLYEEPEAWNELLARLVDVTADYLNAQVAAGAEAVQVFDSWVGHLAPADYARAILPHMQRLFGRLDRRVPAIHFSTGTGGYVELIAQAGGDVVGVDWRVPIGSAWERVGSERAIQGNLDPAVLLGPRREIAGRVKDILGEVGGRPGHVFNLGHGVLPTTPVDNVLALVDAVHELSAR
ncbi:MAG TPA: uroporphyrinogen decarboxylase [Candidatus Binatia bacterium]|nr:uroporphyrinogen decarboxylase [Candidatus Binatia bacterium]